MNDLAPNLPEVVEEVRARFERYERALVEKDVEVLDDTFWRSPHTIRYAPARERLTASKRSMPTGVRRPAGARASRSGVFVLRS